MAQYCRCSCTNGGVQGDSRRTDKKKVCTQYINANLALNCQWAEKSSAACTPLLHTQGAWVSPLPPHPCLSAPPHPVSLPACRRANVRHGQKTPLRPSGRVVTSRNSGRARTPLLTSFGVLLPTLCSSKRPHHGIPQAVQYAQQKEDTGGACCSGGLCVARVGVREQLHSVWGERVQWSPPLSEVVVT